MKEMDEHKTGPVSEEDLALINALAKTELQQDQVYTFTVRLCDNEIDRDFERFDTPALYTLGELFVGKSGIFDHDWTAHGQTARIYKTEVVPEGGLTTAGDPAAYLKAYAYMLRGEKTRDLIEEIEGGIKKEVSVGCSAGKRVCSICGQEQCAHRAGKSYGGQLCYFTLSDPTDAYEWSFVAVPAQKKAGIVKTYTGRFRHPAMDSLRLEQLEKEARLGRVYLGSLRKELVRLAGLADGELDLKVFSQAVDRLDEPELQELTRAYRRQTDKLYPPAPQIRSASNAAATNEDSVFQV